MNLRKRGRLRASLKLIMIASPYSGAAASSPSITLHTFCTPDLTTAMQSFTDFLIQTKDSRQRTFQALFRSYSDAHVNYYRKLKQRPPHLSVQKHLQEHEKTMADLEEAERREKANKEATRISGKVTDAATTMIDSTLDHIKSTHIRKTLDSFSA
jgi:hypothetical protein